MLWPFPNMQNLFLLIHPNPLNEILFFGSELSDFQNSGIEISLSTIVN